MVEFITWLGAVIGSIPPSVFFSITTAMAGWIIKSVNAIAANHLHEVTDHLKQIKEGQDRIATLLTETRDNTVYIKAKLDVK